MRSSQDLGAPRAFILGGNANTLAFVTGLSAESDTVTAHLVPIAHTPIGAVLAQTWQDVNVAPGELLDWIDATFPPDDERAFIAPVRDIELLARINWRVEPPAQLDDSGVLNIEDVPEDVSDALSRPPELLAQCQMCRRLCVADHFNWNDRRLCAWDYHRLVFGKRGPWHTGPYEARHFETVPAPAYVTPPLLEEVGADVVLAVAGIADAAAQRAMNVVLSEDPARAHMAVRTADGYSLLRER